MRALPPLLLRACATPFLLVVAATPVFGDALVKWLATRRAVP